MKNNNKLGKYIYRMKKINKLSMQVNLLIGKSNILIK